MALQLATLLLLRGVGATQRCCCATLLLRGASVAAMALRLNF
jgi:hypothetical protein